MTHQHCVQAITDTKSNEDPTNPTQCPQSSTTITAIVIAIDIY